MHCPRDEDLKRFVDEPHFEDEVIEEHVGSCARCGNVLDQLSDNRELRRFVPRALSLSDESSSILLSRILAQIESAAESATRDSSSSTYAAESMLGLYRIEKEIGRGGMGVVWRAFDESLGRRIAIKMVHAQHSDPKARRRLVREAQAVAKIDHRNVITIHSVVNPPDESPFLVMEYLEGATLAARIKLQKRLEPRVAAALVAQAADGLAAAHLAGLIHRDVKPSNILVDNSGCAKITDFGLARLTESASDLTQEGIIAGTPTYMSPEQARGEPNLDCRSDIYGLGVTLYEALTGEVPFRGSTRRVLEQVIHAEAPPLCAWDDAIPRDLETICLKALAKEPERRYQRAEFFRDDLQRWLAGEAILARPVGRIESAWRWCKRRPMLVSTTAAFLLALLGGLASTTVQWRRAEANAWQARRAASLALENLRDARQAVDKFLSNVSESPELREAGMQPLRRKLLRDAMAYYQRFLDRHGNQETLEEGAADLAFRLAQITLSVGTTDEAVAACNRAVECQQALADADPGTLTHWNALARSCVFASMALQQAGRLDEASLACRRGALACQNGLERDAKNEPLSNLLLTCNGNLANTLLIQGKRAEARAIYQQMQGVWEARAGLRPQNDGLRNNLAQNLCNLATVGDDPTESLRLLQRALQLRQELWNQQPKNYELGYLVARTLGWIAQKEAELGHDEESLASFMEAANVLQKIIRSDPAVGKYQRTLGELRLAIGKECTKLRRFKQAEAELAEARRVYLKVLEGDPDLLVGPAQLTEATKLIAAVYRELRRPDDAVAAIRETGEALRLATGKSSATAQVRGHVADQFVQIAALERELGMMNDALATLVKDARPIASGPDALVCIALEMARCLVPPKTTSGLATPDGAFAEKCAEETVLTVRLAVESGFNDFGRLQNEPALSALLQRSAVAALLAAPRPVNPPKR